MMVQTPAGGYTETDPTQLLERVGALLKGDFTLASGKKSPYYFDSKLLTLHPDGAYFVAVHLTEKLQAEGIKYIGGTAYGAIPIVSAVVLYSQMNGGTPIEAFYHRKEAKGHGNNAEVDGRRPPVGTRVAILEDVVTTGDSLLKAIDLAEGLGCEVTDAIVLVDRNEGGREVVEAKGYRFWSLFTVNLDGDGKLDMAFSGR